MTIDIPCQIISLLTDRYGVGKHGSTKPTSIRCRTLVSTPSVFLYVPGSVCVERVSQCLQLGYWIVEDLVNRQTEFYPRGGLTELVLISITLLVTVRLQDVQKRGLRQLKAANIAAILDLHAGPGVQTPGHQFTGRCTSDVEFYVGSSCPCAYSITHIATLSLHQDRSQLSPCSGLDCGHDNSGTS